MRRVRPSADPTRPTAILLMPPGAVLAGVVQQARAYVLPNGVRPIEPESIGRLNFNDAKAAQTFNAEQVPGDFRKSALLDRQPRLTSGASVRQHRIPPPIRGLIRRRLWSPERGLRGKPLHLLTGWHSP